MGQYTCDFCKTEDPTVQMFYSGEGIAICRLCIDHMLKLEMHYKYTEEQNRSNIGMGLKPKTIPEHNFTIIEGGKSCKD